MKMVQYAPHEIPITLTARAAIVHLGDHLQAFLNANNISSWAPTKDYVLRDDSLADMLVRLGTARGMSVAQMKYQAKRLRRLAKAGGGAIKLSYAYNLVANCLGYRDFSTSLMCRSVDHYVDNLWSTGMIGHDSLLESAKSSYWPSSKVTDELRARMLLNKKRSELIREIKSRDKRERTHREQELLNIKRDEISKRATAPIIMRD